MNENRFIQLIRCMFVGGAGDSDDIEIRRKVILANAICIIGMINLIPLGVLAIINARPILGYLDLTVAVILIVIMFWLRRTGYHHTMSYFGVSFAGALFVFLFATGGVGNTGHLWSYTFPLFTAFLLGSKKGAIVTSVLFSLVILVFIFQDLSPLLAVYPMEFIIRFVTSFLVVSSLSYVYENLREKAQQQLADKNVDLEKIIEDLKQTEDKRKETAVMLESVLNSIPDVLGIHGRDYEIIRYNKAGYQFVNRPPEAVKSRKCYELIGRNAPCDPCAVSETYRTHKQAMIEKYVEKEGTWLDMRSYPVLDEKGKISYIVKHLRDITEAKQAVRALYQSEERYRSIVENTIYGFYIFDISSGRFLFLNQRACELYGYTLQEGLTLSVWDAISPKDHDQARQRMQSLDKQKKLGSGTNIYTAIRRDGSTFRLEVSSSVIIFQNKPAIQGVFRDITEQERLEQQLKQAQKMEAIGTLAGGIAHDFNNILSPIMIHSEMIMNDLPADSLLQHNVQEIYKAAERARELVKQILTFSRQEEQKKTLIQLQLVLKESLALLRSFIPATVEIKQEIHPRTATILADPTQIQQVLMNLCTNAVHAMGEKGGTLEVVLSEEDAVEYAGDMEPGPGEYVRLAVKDTGKGIDPRIMERIFDPYFTTKAPDKGTGLGLAVVHGIVESIGGDILVESKMGQGTTFTIRLPKVKPAAMPAAELKADVPGGSEKVLFVDDEKMSADIIQQALDRLGYQVTARTSSVEALAVFRNRPDAFDLIITDMTMPNMTGIELAGEIQQIRPDIPIVLCTGFSEQISSATAGELGLAAFVMKPFSIREMARTLRKVLDKT